MPEHQKVHKMSQRVQSIQDKRKPMQKENAAAEEEVRKLRDEVKQKEERIPFLSDKVEKNKMGDARHGSRTSGVAGRRREKSQQCFADWRKLFGGLVAANCCSVCAAVGPNKVDAFADAVLQKVKESGAVQGQMPGRDERRRNSEDEQEQGRASQQVALPTSGGLIQGAPAGSLELDLPLVRGAPGEGGSARRSSAHGDRKRGVSRSPGRHSMDDGGDDDLGGLVPQAKKREKQPTKGPKNL